MIARVRSAALMGMDPYEVTVEAEVSRGLPKFEIVGLAQTSVQEGRNRILAALRSSGISWTNKRVVVNLAPASIAKHGANFDLPIAMALLMAMGLLPQDKLRSSLVLGELGLDGSVRGIRGAPIFIDYAIRQDWIDLLLLPMENQEDCSFFPLDKIITGKSLEDLLRVLQGEKDPDKICSKERRAKPNSGLDFSQVRGQELGRRAAEIAAAGGHHLLLSGPPGVGKTLIARRFPGILPPLSSGELAETLKIRSLVEGFGARPVDTKPPFREPHHSASLAGMVGSGLLFRPGELSLAHRGILFLDELPEYRRDVIEVLREPLETGFVSLTRAAGSFHLPARFQLIAAMNLCPCGAMGDSRRECSCAPIAVERYRRKISGPIRDRLDLISTLSRPKFDDLWSLSPGESSAKILSRVLEARDLQLHRYQNKRVLNAGASPEMLREASSLGESEERFLKRASSKWNLSARSLHKTIAIARTLADLESCQKVQVKHLSEALQYRWETLNTF